MATAYWEKRVKLAQRSIDRRDKALIDKLSNSFDRINGQLNSDINKIVSTYTRKTGLTPEQAFKYLNEGVPLDVRNELLAKIQTVATPGERRKLETLMNTDRYQGRITRLDAIRADTRIALTKNAEVQLAEVTNHLKATAQSSYARSMFDIQKASGFAFSPHGVSAASINKILRTPWSGATYSSRVWKARDAMAANLDGMMIEMFSMGKLSDQSLKDLRGSVDLNKWRQQATSKFKSETDYAKYAVNRLVRTETTYVANAADAEAYEECEIEKYEFISVLDMRTSPVCREHDGKIYALSEKEEGVNYPPLHPFCRSAVAPSLDSVNRAELQRRARDPKTGKNVLIPADMDYNEWKAWVDDGSPDINGWRADVLNKENDKVGNPKPADGKILNEKERVDHVMKLTGATHEEAVRYEHAVRSYSVGGQLTDAEKIDLDAFIEKSAKYEGSVFRGIACDEEEYKAIVGSLKQGEEYNGLNRAESWTSDRDVAAKYAKEKAKWMDSVVFECDKNVSGAPVAYISGHPSEAEVLLPSNAKWKVIKIEETMVGDSKKAIVTLSEIKSEASSLTSGVSSLTGNKGLKAKLGDTGMQPGAVPTRLEKLKAIADSPNATSSDKIEYLRQKVAVEGFNSNDAKEAGRIVHEETHGKLDKAIAHKNELNDEVIRLSGETSKLTFGSPEREASMVKVREAQENLYEANRVVRVTSKEQAEQTKAAFAKIRPMGATKEQLEEHIVIKGGVGSEFKNVVAKALNQYPTEWIEDSIAQSKLQIGFSERGSYFRGKNTIYLSGKTKEQQEKVALHELGHRMEHINGRISDASKKYLEERTAGEKARWLGEGYGKYEVAKFDKWMEPYMGKVYYSDATEQLSMATEYIFGGYEKMPKDMDFVHYYQGVMALI